MIPFKEKVFDTFTEASQFIESLDVSNPTCQICTYQNGVEWVVTWIDDSDVAEAQIGMDFD